MSQSQKIAAVEERRESPRMKYSVPVRVFSGQGEGAPDDFIVNAVSYDISISGMRIFSTIPLDQKVIFVQFVAPDQELYLLKSTVVREIHRNEWTWEYGLSFETRLTNSGLGSVIRHRNSFE